MKIHAMKNDPRRTLGEMEDIRFILTLPGIDEGEIRGYFERAGLPAAMSSSDWGDMLDLNRDLPTTAEDIAALDRLRYGRRLTFDQYLECLAALEVPSPARLRSRPRPTGGDAPFDLIR